MGVMKKGIVAYVVARLLGGKSRRRYGRRGYHGHRRHGSWLSALLGTAGRRY